MCKGKCHLFLRFYWNCVQVYEHNFTVINTSYNHLSPAENAIGLSVFFSEFLTPVMPYMMGLARLINVKQEVKINVMRPNSVQ